MSIRQDIYTILSTLPYQVFQSRIDPFDNLSELPGISVQYSTIDRKLISFNMYEATYKVSIFVGLAKTDGYDEALDLVNDAILTTLLTDASWVAKFEKIPTINTVYLYEEGGQQHLAKSRIDLTLIVSEPWEPNLQHTLDSLNVKIDFIKPYDLNLASIGPDGRLEANYIINT